MNNPFLDSTPFVSPSMNRVWIVDLPGLSVEPFVKGKSAYDLLSAAALAQLIRGQAQALQIDPDTADLIHAFDSSFTVDAVHVRAAASEIAARFGRYLAYLLLTLKRGDAVNRAARRDWDERHWTYWANIHTVWLGGGLLAGNLGQRMLPHARTVLAACGYPEYQLNLSTYPGLLPLIGAARYAPPEADTALLFDFGHSHVKRAVSFYRRGTLTAVHRLPALASPCLNVDLAGGEAPLAAIEQQAAAMVELVATTWLETVPAGQMKGLPVIASLACYMHQGHPYPYDTGCYGRLQQLGDNLQVCLSARLSERLSRPVDLQLVHDGTAAATVYAGAEQTAVLTLGTAIGIGFPPSPTDLPPVATLMEIGD